MIKFATARTRVTRRVEPEGEFADVRKQLVVTARWVRELEEWCKRQPGRAPNFSEAVRRIVEERIASDRARDAISGKAFNAVTGGTSEPD